MIKTAVVILNYNGRELLGRFLPSVVQHSGDAEVFVADNGSTDDSLAFVRENFPSVNVIALGSNFGFSEGYNRALQQITALYYVLLNSDVEVTDGWLSPMVRLLESDHMIAALQPKIKSYRDRAMFEYAGAGGGFIDILGYPFCRGRVFAYIERDNGQYDDDRQIFWASGACMMIRSSIFHAFGGLDEDLFAHMEEIDLCWRIQRTQYTVRYCGASTVYHLGAGTLGYDSPRKTYLNFRNGLLLLVKHLDKKELVYKLPVRVILDWIAAFFFLARGNAAGFLAVFKAHLHFLWRLRRFYIKRKKLRRDFPWYSRKAVYPKSILVEHFIRGKKVIAVQ